jgi:hypothetical protein
VKKLAIDLNVNCTKFACMKLGIWLILQVIEKLSVKRPSGQTKLKLMKDVAVEFNIEWDSSVIEKELTTTPADLLVSVEISSIAILCIIDALRMLNCLF